VEFAKNNKVIDYLIINTNTDKTSDRYTLLYFIPDHITDKGYDRINISPIVGDGRYHIYFLETLNNPDFTKYEFDSLVNFKIDKIELDIEDEYLHKMEDDRRDAIKMGILLSDGVYMPADIYVDGEKYKTELRLKGDWTDHLKGSKWSFRIKIKKDSVWGMNEFSIQNPDSRDGIGEYLIQEYYRKAGGVALRYNFVDVIINGAYMGVYAVEEGFNKRAIESSLKREGVIIKQNENLLWESRAYYLDNEEKTGQAADFTPYSMKKTVGDEKFRNYATYAINNLNQFFNKKTLSFNDVFDAQMFASYLAIMDVFHSLHGTTWHNMRYYYNPVTGLIEPIAFDELIYSSSNDTSTNIAGNYKISVVNFLKNDEKLKQLYFNKLYMYAEGFEAFISSQQKNIDKFNYILARDGYTSIDLTRAYAIVDKIIASKENQEVKFEYAVLEDGRSKITINNSNMFPVEISKIMVDGKEIDIDEKYIVNADLRDKNNTIEYRLSSMSDIIFSDTAVNQFKPYDITGYIQGSYEEGKDGAQEVTSNE
jgi:hypothetical protein